MVYSTRQTRKNRWYIDRISLLKWFMILFFVVILGRLFQLQILDYQEYSTYAQQRMKDKIITASRGRILLKDGENEYFELANNVSLELLFGDPYLIQQRIEEKAKLQVEKPERAAAMDAPLPSEIAQKLAPLLFGMIKEQSTSCDENPLCISQALEEAFFSKKRYLQQEEYKKQQLLDPDFKIPEEVFRDEEELLQEYISDLTESLSRT
ncbi:MAG: hypothetical protein U1C97_01740, partial [Candidatus Gracilibacteria bacterium]|nr:hypothetical protein [Candidatus Gracilibacteria bacterium]